MGHLLGHAVRFGPAGDVMAAGEGIETMLSLRCVMPSLTMVAALSAAHLAAILFPATLRRLHIVRDDDRAGDGAVAGLFDRAQSAGIEAMVMSLSVKISTRICGILTSARYVQRCASSSPWRTLAGS
jgi:hypothetical protein